MEIILGNAWLIGSRPRHLLPTEFCEGSPSRVQYLEGQPRDSRPEYPYNEAWEARVRDAYAELLQIAKNHEENHD